MNKHTFSPASAGQQKAKPEILAPAGDMEAALAAFAAGADAVYLGLKHFSARMLSENFSLTELSRLSELAHAEKRKIYIALNTVLKNPDLASAGRLIARLAKDVRPDALIIQDLAALELARQTGFPGELHLSTLANVTHPAALHEAARLGADRVILPRELSIDEIRQTCAAAPPGLALELFVHGALCYCVSGRCYWSSYLGGKSGLRGRCVQPCRRVYTLKNRAAAFFSCLDLSLDVMAKTLLDIANLKSWKIEGRRKGPHYVYYVTTAYRLLRDNSTDPQIKKSVEDILAQALGRTGTRGTFLPQHSAAVTNPDGQTASGQFIGKIQWQQPETGPGAGRSRKKTKPGPGGGPAAARGPELVVKPRIPLLPADYLRVGMEDDPGHFTTTVSLSVPKNGCLTLNAKGKTVKSGAPVYLIDRREPELAQLLRQWADKLKKYPAAAGRPVGWQPKLRQGGITAAPRDLNLYSAIPQIRNARAQDRQALLGLWLSPRTVEEISRTVVPKISWWLPPVIWPAEEAKTLRLLEKIISKKAAHLVCNAPWQLRLLRDAAGGEISKLQITAGPFCNITNQLSLEILGDSGFSTAVVSPELSGPELLELPALSVMPLGVVLSGYWPVGISRHGQNPRHYNTALLSPMRETFWLRRYGQNTWIYPNWPLNLKVHKEELVKAGYALFVHMDEHLPKDVTERPRPGLFNWETGLL